MIVRPAWCKDAVPTLKGWKHPKRREILQSRSFTQEEIDEWMSANAPRERAPEPAPAPEPVVEASDDSDDLSSMSKDELEAWAREHLDVELDKRKTKKALLTEIEEHRNG